MDVFYFGCRDRHGHYFHKPGNRSDLEPPHGFPWGVSVDGGLQPPIQREPGGSYTGASFKDGEAIRHVKDGWTAVAYWDRTVDSRPGSCSVLVCHGVCTTPEVVARVKHAFPDCVRVPVVEIGVVGERRFRTADHPLVGRTDVEAKGLAETVIWFPLPDETTLVIEMGARGEALLRELIGCGDVEAPADHTMRGKLKDN